MAIVVDDVLRITAVMQFDSIDDIVNVYHCKVSSNVTVDDDQFMTQMAGEMDSLYDLINGGVSDLQEYIDVQGQNLTQNVLLPSKDWPNLTFGGSVSTALPSQVAASVFHRTLRPNTRASKYLGIFTEAQNDGNGSIGAGFQANLQSYADQLNGGFVGGGFVAAYGAYNVALDRFTPADSGIVPARWRTQRRRRLGVGS